MAKFVVYFENMHTQKNSINFFYSKCDISWKHDSKSQTLKRSSKCMKYYEGKTFNSFAFSCKQTIFQFCSRVHFFFFLEWEAHVILCFWQLYKLDLQNCNFWWEIASKEDKSWDKNAFRSIENFESKLKKSILCSTHRQIKRQNKDGLWGKSWLAKEDVTIKLSHSIDVDKDDRNGELARVYVRVCAFIPIIIDGECGEICRTNVMSNCCTLYFDLINLSRSTVTKMNGNRFPKLITWNDNQKTWCCSIYTIQSSKRQSLVHKDTANRHCRSPKSPKSNVNHT